MEKPCHRCSAQISEDAPFCPACGAPQIRVSPRFEASVQDVEGPVVPQPPPPVAQAGLASGPRPGEIQWRVFLRTAWPLGALAGLIAAFLPAVGVLIVVPLSVVIGISLYRKHHVGRLRAGQGAKLGMAVGLCGFIAFGGLSVAALVAKPGVRQELVQRVDVVTARNPDPQVQQLMHELINSPQGFALAIAGAMVVLMVFFLFISAITGAVAASAAGGKNP